MDEIHRKLYKGITAVKNLDNDRIKKLVMDEKNPNLLSIGRIIKKYRGQDESTESGTVSFEILNRHISALAQKKGISYKALNLIKAFRKPENFAFVAGREPLSFYPHVIAAAPAILERIKNGEE